jgi:hypothetical protein
MNRRNFAGSSGVVIDICVHHGVWFDDGELGQVLFFCSSGELTKSQRFDRERKRARRGIGELQDQLNAIEPRNYLSKVGASLDIPLIAGVLRSVDDIFMNTSPPGQFSVEQGTTSTSKKPISKKLALAEREAAEQSRQMHAHADKVVLWVLVVGGIIVGALFGAAMRLEWGLRPLLLNLAPPVVTISGFAILGGVIGWRAARRRAVGLPYRTPDVKD